MHVKDSDPKGFSQIGRENVAGFFCTCAHASIPRAKMALSPTDERERERERERVVGKSTSRDIIEYIFSRMKNGTPSPLIHCPLSSCPSSDSF